MSLFNSYYKKLAYTIMCLTITTLFTNNGFCSTDQDKEISAEQTISIPMEDVQRFTSALTQIKHYYVKDVGDSKLFEDAIRGMLSGLDPHSSYLDATDYEELTTATSGKFGGVGIEITSANNVIKIIAPIEDSPAFKAGIKSGDYIIKIDQKSIYGMKLGEAIKMMRGEKGTNIELTIIRPKHEEPLVFNVKRDIIKIKSIKSKLFEKKYGYIRISHFQETSAKNFVAAIKKLNTAAESGLKGLILDLRDNPGGLLDSAIDISDTMIHNDQKGEEELIVLTKGRIPNSKFTAKANPGDILKGEPIVVLINGGSASGSEIVAGALQDNKRAILVGTNSFGKGSVQTIIPIDEKRAIKLTTALYYTPSGQSIQATGLKPDITVENISMVKNNDAKKKRSLIISEASLHKHFKNITKPKKETTVNKNKEVLDNDYQLSEALKILKAMRLTANR